MRPRRRSGVLSSLACFAIGASVLAIPARAQSPNPLPKGWLRTAGVGFVAQTPAGLKNGGDMRWSAFKVEAGLLRVHPDGWSAGGGAQYIVQDFAFQSPPAFGGQSPWERIDSLSLALFASPKMPEPWTLKLQPSVRMSHEFGADAHDAWAYGFTGSVQRRINPKLQLGLGMGVFRDLERTRGFPMLMIDWNVTDRLRITNPRPAGPAGPAGLEASWSMTPAWTLGMGASYYSDRFRLKDGDGTEADIGQWRGMPVWTRVSWRKGPIQANLLGGCIAMGQLRTETRNGDELVMEDVSPAPFVAFTLSVPLHLHPPARQ